VNSGLHRHGGTPERSCACHAAAVGVRDRPVVADRGVLGRRRPPSACRASARTVRPRLRRTSRSAAALLLDVRVTALTLGQGITNARAPPAARTDHRPGSTHLAEHPPTRSTRRHPPQVPACHLSCTDAVSGRNTVRRRRRTSEVEVSLRWSSVSCSDPSSSARWSAPSEVPAGRPRTSGGACRFRRRVALVAGVGVRHPAAAGHLAHGLPCTAGGLPRYRLGLRRHPRLRPRLGQRPGPRLRRPRRHLDREGAAGPVHQGDP
jgi:hypothetical protein